MGRPNNSRAPSHRLHAGEMLATTLVVVVVILSSMRAVAPASAATVRVASFFGLSQGDPPALSTASVTSDAVAQATGVSLAFDFDRALTSGTVTTSTVTLQAHGTNRQGGTPSGASGCMSVGVDTDGSGNPNRRITCAHGALASGTWYTVTVAGGSGGIQSSGAVAMVSTLTRRFKTAYGAGSRETAAASELSNMVVEGWFTRTGDPTAASKLAAVPELATTATVGSGTATITVPQNAEITKTGGGTFDATAFAMTDATTTISGVAATLRAAVQYGVPGTSLIVSAPVTIRMPVSSALNGATLQMHRSLDVDFSDDTTQLTTCVVASGACEFTTTNLSYFAVSGSAGAPKVDEVPPRAPTRASASAAPGGVTITWRDPTASDLRSIRVLLAPDGDRTELRAAVPPGIRRYVDPTTDLTPGESYVYQLQAEDESGNRSPVVRLAPVRIIAPPELPPPPIPRAPEGTPPPVPSASSVPTPLPIALPNFSTPSLLTSPASTSVPPVAPSSSPHGTAALPPSLGTFNDAPAGIADFLPPPPSFPWSEIRPTLPPFPCTLTDSQQALAAYAFSLTQGVFPSTPRDLEVACNLFIDPRNPVDITERFPKYRRPLMEEYGFKNFVNFFLRPPSRTFRNEPTTVEIAAGDWWVVKYMAYHLHLLPTFRNAVSERRCTRLFIERDIDLYKSGIKVRKSAGDLPVDAFDFDFIRACAYSGAAFPGGR